jgi:predicted nucleic acid-binding protein
MPALERLFSDPPPTDLYLDTDLVIAYLIDTEPHHIRCRDFLRRLGEQGRTALYVSSLCWVELANVVTKERFRNQLSPANQRRFQLARWREVSIRRTYIDSILRAFETALAQFTWHEVALESGVRTLVAEYVASYNLGAHDATHLASARYAGVSDLASLDEAFRRVDNLVLWNDGIHVRRT